MTSSTAHYSPQLMHLLIEVVPRLCRGKRDVLSFFRTSGVQPGLYSDLEQRLRADKASVGKRDLATTVLERLNEGGDATLGPLRQVLRNVTEFQNFSTCWESDQHAAKGLVTEIRELVGERDSVSRLVQQFESERRARLAEEQARAAEHLKQRSRLDTVKQDLYALFRETDHARRGKALEPVLTRLFEASGMLVREPFTRKDPEGHVVLEQVDGAVEIDGNLFLVEMKWWNQPLGPEPVGRHLVRVFTRGDVHGLFISASGYTAAAIQDCRDSLVHKVVVLCKLEEIVLALEQEHDLLDLLRQKIHAAKLDKNPLHEPFSLDLVADG